VFGDRQRIGSPFSSSQAAATPCASTDRRLRERRRPPRAVPNGGMRAHLPREAALGVGPQDLAVAERREPLAKSGGANPRCRALSGCPLARRPLRRRSPREARAALPPLAARSEPAPSPERFPAGHRRRCLRRRRAG
jgi:hypothetical protein